MRLWKARRLGHLVCFDSAGVGFVNSGTVNGGNAASPGRAIDLSESDGDNTVALLSGSQLGGTVVGSAGQDTLILDGSGSEDADISAIERVGFGLFGLQLVRRASHPNSHPNSHAK